MWNSWHSYVSIISVISVTSSSECSCLESVWDVQQMEPVKCKYSPLKCHVTLFNMFKHRLRSVIFSLMHKEPVWLKPFIPLGQELHLISPHRCLHQQSNELLFSWCENQQSHRPYTDKVNFPPIHSLYIFSKSQQTRYFKKNIFSLIILVCKSSFISLKKPSYLKNVMILMHGLFILVQFCVHD